MAELGYDFQTPWVLQWWYYNGSSTKLYVDVNKLIHNVIWHDGFKSSDFAGTFSTAHEAKWMDMNDKSSKISAKPDKSQQLPFKTEDGWIKTSVSIPVPCDSVKFKSEEDTTICGQWNMVPTTSRGCQVSFYRACCRKFSHYPFQRILEAIKWWAQRMNNLRNLLSRCFQWRIWNIAYNYYGRS